MVIRRYINENTEIPYMYEIGHWMPDGNWNAFLRYEVTDGDVESAAATAVKDLHILNGGR